jgi:hypothetical protein
MLVLCQQGSMESHTQQFYGELLQFATMWMPDHQVTRPSAVFVSFLAPPRPPRSNIPPPVASGKYVAANRHPAFGGVHRSVWYAAVFPLGCARRIAPSPNNPPVASGPDLSERKGQKLCYLGFMRFIAVRERVQHMRLMMSLRFMRHACRHFTKRTQTRHLKCASTTWPRPGATWCVPTDAVSLCARA